MNRLFEIARAKRGAGRIYRDLDTLLVISHMRGFTTLLSHLLGSHPEIAGYFETHSSYRELKDLLRLRTTLDDADGLSGSERWIVDKVLGCDMKISDEVLRREDVHLLFSLRRPRATLKSMIATRERYGWDMGRDDLVEYYFRRLPQIADFARRAPGGYYLDAEAIVEDTDRALAALTGALRLSTPLEPEFATRSMTGVPGYGCPSDYIGQGKIVRDRERYEDIGIDAELLRRAERSYRDCREALLANCEPLALLEAVDESGAGQDRDN